MSFLLGCITGFIVGIACALLVSIYAPERFDKAKKEAKEELP